MDFIKSGEKVISSVNELISGYGDPKELAESIDIVMFEWLDSLMRGSDCAGNWHADTLSNVKAVRDLIKGIETINL